MSFDFLRFESIIRDSNRLGFIDLYIQLTARTKMFVYLDFYNQIERNRFYGDSLIARIVI